MANNSTRKECFKRELFGLPHEFSDFVLQVKTGMLLFLFDYQEKNLYGVFEATSDGAMNIVPDAYTSTSKRFPAQVRFSTLWRCDPIPEQVFRDSIKENYYQRYKFSFGLSRDQVGRLLFLFEKRMHKVPKSPVREIQHQRSSQIEQPVVATHPGPVENSALTDSLQVLITEKLDNLDTADHGDAPELEDYIPLPAIDPEEIEDPSDAFLWGANFSAIWSFGEEGETNEEKNIDRSIRYQVGGWKSDNSKPSGCSSEPKNSKTQEESKEIDDSSCLQVQGLYADSSKTRTSVFMRLSGLGKMMAEERHCRSKSKRDSARDILKELDKRRTMWNCQRSTEKASKSGISVFTRLRSNDGKVMESQQKGEVHAAKTKQVDIAKKSTHENLKRKSSCSVKYNGTYHDDLAERERKRLRSKHSGKSSRVTNNSKFSSNVPDLSDEHSVCTINSACQKAL